MMMMNTRSWDGHTARDCGGGHAAARRHARITLAWLEPPPPASLMMMMALCVLVLIMIMMMMFLASGRRDPCDHRCAASGRRCFCDRLGFCDRRRAAPDDADVV